MSMKNTSRGDYYKDRASREAEDEFFDAPEEYKSNFRATQENARRNGEKAVFDKEERSSGAGKIITIVLVGIVSILAVLLATYYVLMNQGKVPEVGPLTTRPTTVATEATTLPPDSLEDGTLPGEGENIVINGTTVGNTSNAGGNAARQTTVKGNDYVRSADSINSTQVRNMVNRSAHANGDVLIWDNIIEDDTDLTHYNYEYQAAYYRATSENEDIHAIQKNTVYIFLTATNKDPSVEGKGMLVLRGENVYDRNGNLTAEYMEGEMDSCSDANSFISSYMANKSGFTRIN